MKNSGWDFVTRVLVLGVFSAVIITTGCEKEVKTTIDKVPAPVKITIEKMTAGGTIKEIEKEQHKDKIVYEAEYIKDGQKGEIEIAEDGSIIKVKEKMAIDKVPAAVKAAIEKAAAGGKIKEIKREQHKANVVYDVEYEKSGKEIKATFAENGSPVTEKKADEDEK